MNYMALQDPTETAVRNIIDSHRLPDFVRGYDIWLDEFDGTPGVWIRFNVLPIPELSEAGILERGRELVAIQDDLEADFKEKVPDRFPFYRFAEVQHSRANG